MSAFGILWRAAVLYLGLAAALPTSTKSLGPHPKPVRDYEAAIQLAQAFRRADTLAAKGGESILLAHDHRTPRAFVLFHGFANSPHQMSELADTLYQRGDNVFVPRLPQHGLRGGTAGDLRHLTAESLRDVADASIDVASGLGDTVVVLGFSLGGNMAAWTAQYRQVSRVVIVSPALGLSHVSTVAQTPVMNLVLRLPNYSHDDPPDTLRSERALGWSSRGVGQMLRLGAAVRRAADEHAPAAGDIRVLVNASDETVNRDAIDEIASHWLARGGHVSMFELPDSHGLPHDVIDPDEFGGNTKVTYAVILSLLYGSTLPADLGVRAVRLQIQ
jgi:esterase/lipase